MLISKMQMPSHTKLTIEQTKLPPQIRRKNSESCQFSPEKQQ